VETDLGLRRRQLAGKVTPALFDCFRARIAELTPDPDTFWTDQFNNVDALDGYAHIGREILEQAGPVDAFAGAVGTAGMLAGVSRAFKAAGCAARIVALEPSTSPSARCNWRATWARARWSRQWPVTPG